MIEPVETILKNHVADFLARHHINMKPLAIAFSGGVDSIVLLEILHRLRLDKSLPSLALQAIHVNHGISPNANAWADFCHAECLQRDIPITVEVIAVDSNSGAGLEAAAREARYRALQKNHAAFILTAQHQDDQAETVLHQMLRGTGLKGLAAMGEARALSATKTLLRPLLAISRESIEAYATAHSLRWIEDESNNDTAYTRNFIRHQLVPVIAERFPQYAESLARTARHAAENAELNEALAKIDLRWNGTEAFADALDVLPSNDKLPRQVNALYYWLRWQNITTASHSQLEDWAVQLFRESPESRPHQAGGHEFIIQRKRDRLELLLNQTK